ncbi:hypothetical protein Tco_0230293, partial [Tanacetum coccineum]
EEGIDFEESFAPVARLEAVRIFVAYVAHFWRNIVPRVRGVICKLCSSNVDEDTASRLWL